MLFNQTDQQLIDKALNGSQRGWLKLVTRYEDRLYNYCLRICGSEADAMELVQEVFVAVFRNLPNFKGQSKFATWLFRIAANKSTDWIRGKHRVPTWGADEVEPHHRISHQSPQDDAQAGQDNQFIVNSLQKLPAEQRVVVELKFFQYFTFDEIATQIGITPATAKSRLYAGLKKLKGDLELKNVV